jgi:hypothetical protein
MIFLDGFVSSDRLAPAVDATSTAGRTVCPFSWEPPSDFSESRINILWLSSTIFISPILFCTHHDVLPDYTIGFQDRSKDSFTPCRVYSLSAFQGGVVREPSLLPLLFLEHLTATLPVDYFSNLFLRRIRNKLQFCPIDCIVRFLSIMSSSDLREVTHEERETTFELDGRRAWSYIVSSLSPYCET